MPLEIDQLRLRIDEILNHVTEAPESRTPAIAHGLDQLREVLSEFVASGEELYHKIEELLAARDALELERQQYRDLFESAPDAHIVTDLDAHIRFANTAAASLLQVRTDTLISQSFLHFVSEQDRLIVLRYIGDLKGPTGNVPQYLQLTMWPRHEESFVASITVVNTRSTPALPAALHWVLREGIQPTLDR